MSRPFSPKSLEKITRNEIFQKEDDTFTKRKLNYSNYSYSNHDAFLIDIKDSSLNSQLYSPYKGMMVAYNRPQATEDPNMKVESMNRALKLKMKLLHS